MSSEESLQELGEKTAEVVLEVLASLCSDGVETGQVSVVPKGVSPLYAISYPVMASDVAYTEGITGGNIFTITRLGARRLAATMMYMEPPTEDTEEELDEMELSALGEAMNQMMAAGAQAVATALGYPVEISVPTTRVLTDAAAAEGLYPQTPYATSVTFTVLGEPCRLIQLIPNTFIVRMAHALDSGDAEPDSDAEESLSDPRISFMLRGVPVRVAAELGRATLSLEQVADPRPGSVIELNRSSEDPVDLCVNGQRFATGRLFLIDQTEWAMRIEHVLDVDPADYVSQIGGT